jgi:hypothetical protein
MALETAKTWENNKKESIQTFGNCRLGTKTTISEVHNNFVFGCSVNHMTTFGAYKNPNNGFGCVGHQPMPHLTQQEAHAWNLRVHWIFELQK